MILYSPYHFFKILMNPWRPPTRISFTIALIFHNCLSWLARSKHLLIFFCFLLFTVVHRNAKMLLYRVNQNKLSSGPSFVDDFLFQNYYFTSYEFMIPANACGLSWDSEWQQVASSLRILPMSFISAMLLFGWSRFIIRCPIRPALFGSLYSTIPMASITIGITITLMFYRFIRDLVDSKYFSIFSFSFFFTLWSTGTPKLIYGKFFIFFFVNQHKVWSSGQKLVISL